MVLKIARDKKYVVNLLNSSERQNIFRNRLDTITTLQLKKMGNGHKKRPFGLIVHARLRRILAKTNKH